MSSAASYDRGMPDSTPQLKSCKAELGHMSGPRFHPFESYEFKAISEQDATDKAIEWGRKNRASIDPGVSLRLTIDHRVIYIDLAP